MVFMLPSEFIAPDDDCEEQDSEEAMAQLNLEPIPATFEKPEDEKCKHLKALFLKGFVDGKPVEDASRWRSSSEYNAVCHVAQAWKK